MIGLRAYRGVGPLVAVAMALTVWGGAAAAAKPPLREVAQINDGLFHIAVANEIRKSCDSIDARVLKAVWTMQALKRQAKDLGYTEAEIDAFTSNDAEKDRMRARGAKYYAERGVDPANPQDMCALGRAEIETHSQIGVLLRAK